ncbi:hypothetical protein V500_02996 [Pseudogymnoascus sp. VKM F-4518 (FW-2643)]|nr:hypothetical protein V500_02996 [Pseudogymnoascus sp. VKM F-4518 (FW-2643)]
MLLEKGADVNAQGGRHGNALQAASYGGNDLIEQRLLEKGADISPQRKDYYAMESASYEGHDISEMWSDYL